MYKKDNKLYRQINAEHLTDFNFFINCGLYSALAEQKLLISHKEIPSRQQTSKIIRPEIVPFISYPYEWSFNQLKDAALTTLKIQKIAMKFNMSLRDCSAYNIQFFKGKPIFIDTISFERRKKNTPWLAYRQFCEHFLVPLALMSYRDIRLSLMQKSFIDGIPVNLASKILPLRSYFNFPILLNIHLHSINQKKNEYSQIKKIVNTKISENSVDGLIDSLYSATDSLKWKPSESTWSDYYSATHNYKDSSFNSKKQIVNKYIKMAGSAKIAWDLGSNTGVFSKIPADQGIYTISMDYDFNCVDLNYLECKKNKEANILPLQIDLTNPSGGIGWDSSERDSLIQRGPADIAIGLALMHHLVVTHNIPVTNFIEFLSKTCKFLILEYVPLDDPQVKKMTVLKKTFHRYDEVLFEKEINKYFKIRHKSKVKNSSRSIYLCQKRNFR